MNFPGSNKIELSSKATEALLSSHIDLQLGNALIRVTDVRVSYGGSMTVDFTTDPPPQPRDPARPPMVPQALNVDDVVIATSPVSLKTSDDPL